MEQHKQTPTMETVRSAAVRELQTGRVFAASVHFLADLEARTVFGRDVTCEDGFVTSTGRFVTREEAAKIAVACGQVDAELLEKNEKDWLNTEDYLPEEEQI